MAARFFTLSVQAFVQKTKINTELVLRKASLELFTAIVLKTPVDTGRLRGNWMPSFDAPSTDSTEEVDPDGGPTVEVIAAALSDHQAGQKIYLANNLPYAQAIEDGGSRVKAPAGMVGVSVMEYSDYLDRAVANL